MRVFRSLSTEVSYVQYIDVISFSFTSMRRPLFFHFFVYLTLDACLRMIFDLYYAYSAQAFPDNGL
jgi:hypothetical protein